MKVYDKHVELLTEWNECLKSRCERGVAIIHGEGVYPRFLLESIADGEDVLVFSSSSTRWRWEDSGWRIVSPAKVQQLLGTEWSIVVIDVKPLLLPNLVAAAAEMVKAPGFIAIIADCPWRWDPGGFNGTGGYGRYLRASLPEARNIAVIDTCGSSSLVKCGVGGYNKVWPSKPSVDAYEIPHAIRRLIATSDELNVVRKFLEFMRGGYRSLFITGDRGRGKSSSIGLGLSLMIMFKHVGVVTVTSLSIHQVQTMFRMLIEALKSAGIRHTVLSKGGSVYGVRGPWFHVRYHSVDQVFEPGPILVIDEAASIGPHRLRRLARHARRVIAATTIHGYEGSGRVLAHFVERLLPRPILHVEVQEPIRYPPGDPLEEWLYETFVLRREFSPATLHHAPRYMSLDGWRLSGDKWLVREAFRVLSEAHYRNEPDDLALLLDEPSRRVHLLLEGQVYAVAEVSREWMMDEKRRMLTSILGFHAEFDTLQLKVARIVRIAVHPMLQRRGLGSQLLRRIEEELHGVDVVGAVYSRQEVTRFWLRNGYRVVYVSPRFNRATGEKNIAVAKGLSDRGVSVVAQAEYAARLRLLLAGDSVYRDVPAEVLADILSVKPLAPKEPPLDITSEQSRRLRMFAEGVLDHEAAWDALKIWVVRLLSLRPLKLERRKAVAIVARLIQGKPLTDVTMLLGVSREEAGKIVDEALRELLAEEQPG